MRRLVLMGVCYFLLLGVNSPLRAGVIYDAAADFSLAGNPNGAWSYGYSTTLGGTLILYTVSSTTTYRHNNYSSWRGTDLGDTPTVVKNVATTPIPGEHPNLFPGELAFHPGQFGEFSNVAWTAPDTGSLSLAVTFEGRDDVAGTTTDVHVLDNGVSLFNANVNGFGSPSDQSFSTSLSVTKGEVIDFAVGIGTNGNFISDTTGLSATINFSPASATATPEPASLTLFGLGLLGFAGYGWRRRRAAVA